MLHTRIQTSKILKLTANNTALMGRLADSLGCSSVHQVNSRELKQPRPRRQQERHKFAYLTIKNNSFARFARAFFIFWHLADVLDLSTTWNDLFCSCLDDVSIRWQMFNVVFLPLKRWFQFNSKIVWPHFANVMSLNNSEIIPEMQSDIFIWRSCCRRRRVCLNSLVSKKWRRQRQRHKSMIWLVEWGKIIVLHVRHTFWCEFLM